MKPWLKNKWVFLFLLFFSECRSSSPADFQSEGEALACEITKILSQVQTHDELQAAAPRLKRKFNRLADLLIEVREFQKQKPDAVFLKEPLPASEYLFTELARLYETPGCREIIEAAQTEAVRTLSR